MSYIFTVNEQRKLEDRTPNGLGLSMPIGSIMWFAADNAPESWMVCNGVALSRKTFKALFDVIGTKFGAGDGSTTFNLPNIIDRFIEGATTAGTVKEAGLPNITGEAYSQNGSGMLYGISDQWVVTDKSTGALYLKKDKDSEMAGYSGANSYGSKGFPLRLDASRSSDVYGKSDTVQPPALTMVPCIKVFGSVVNDIGIPLSKVLVPELTDERIIGTLNGAFVYEKTFNATTGALNVYTNLVDCSAMDIKDVISLSGAMQNTIPDWVDCDHDSSADAAGHKIWYRPTTKYIMGNAHNREYAGRPATITIRYTKTTD